MNAQEARAQLEAATEQLRTSQAEFDRAVIDARTHGATWTALASILGVTPQAVQQRYGRRINQEQDR